MTAEQRAQSGVILPLVALIMSSCLAYLVLRSRWHGWRLAGALFVILYGVYAFLSQIETAAYATFADQSPEGALPGFFVSGLILAIPFSPLAVWVLGRTQSDTSVPARNGRLQMPISEWIWQLAAAAVLYVAVYLTFGHYVAQRMPGLPESYGGSDPGSYLGQLGEVLRDTPVKPLFQIFRGLVWAAIGWIIIRMLRGGKWETALGVGSTFSVLTSATMLFPNPFMPLFVARAHALELTSSNFLFGALLTLLLLWEPDKQNPSILEASYAH